MHVACRLSPEVPRVRVLPTEADIVKRRSCAIEVLQTQGRHRRPSAGASVAIAAASGTMGRAAAAEGCAGAGASALVAQVRTPIALHVHHKNNSLQ